MTASIKPIFAFALLLLAAATGPARADEFTVDLGEPGILALDVAAYWSQEVRSPGDGLPPTILLRKDGGERFAMLITPVWAMPGAEPDFGTAESLRRIVKSAAAETAPGAVEEQLTIEPIGGEKTGYMFFATDKSLVGRTPPPNEYLYLMQGAVMVGKLLCTFTILTNDRPSPDAEQALEMLRNAEHRIGA